VQTGGGKSTKDFIRRDVEIFEKVQAALASPPPPGGGKDGG
jgi:hypothetical protein